MRWSVLGAVASLLILPASVWSSYSFEMGGSGNGGYLSAGVDVELEDLSERLNTDLSIFSQGTVNSTKYTDSGSGEIKRELDYSFEGGGRFGFFQVYENSLKALYLSTPDQGITASGGEIELSLNSEKLSLTALSGSLQYQQLIQFSTRRGGRTTDNTLKQDWWGLQAGYDFNVLNLSLGYQKFSYDRDVVQFVNFLNQPVVDYLVGASTSWIRSFPKTRSSVALSVPFRKVWSAQISGQRSILAADSSLERTGSVSLTYDDESRSYTVGAGSGLVFLGVQFH
ncbi:MAG: hypothetical protein LW875_11535 [Proteobacteria bacterium]|nr:hypothetical protein [Pseudomonadota bacterium]